MAVSESGTLGTVIKDVQHLVEMLELADIRFYEVTAQRDEARTELPQDDLVPVHSLGVRFGELGIEVRLAINMATKYGDLRVDGAIRYQSDPPESNLVVAPAIAIEFANRVAMMALLPYLREAVSSISQKVFDDAIVMPIIRAGELAFALGDADDESVPT